MSGRARKRWVLAALAGLAVVGAAAYLWTGQSVNPPAATAGAAKRVPDLRFQDAEGRPRALAEVRGRTVLLNLWATWCVPCREEMPTLDRLQRTLGGPKFEVLALSIDSGGVSDVRRFYDEIGIRSLAVYVDPSMQATEKLRTVGVPTTLLIDREGREMWRRTGPAEWDAPAMVQSIRDQIAKGQPDGR